MSTGAPSRVDPVVRALSGVLGGPAGERSAGHPWWDPTRVLLALTTGVLALGMVGRSACVPTAWSGDKQPFAELCWTELAGTSASRLGPGTPASYVVRLVERLGAVPTTEPRLGTAVALAVLVAAAAFLVTSLLAAADRSLPWAAAGWAAAPVLAVHWLSWDLLAAAGIALLLVAWAHRAPGLAVPGLVLTVAFGHPLVTARTADTGSVWLVVEQATGSAVGVVVRTAVLVGALAAALVAAYVVARRSRARRVTIAARVGVVLVGTLLLVAPSAPPEAALLLLPLAAFAVPRWRDLLVWQACELLAWAITGWHLGGALVPSAGGESRVYWVAVLLRVLGVAWLVTAAVRADARDGSGHVDAVERRRGEPDPDVDLLADVGHARP